MNMKRPNVKRMIERMKKVRIQDALDGLTQEQDAVINAAHYIEWLERLLEDLTPGGSEFHQNPKFCAGFVRGRLESQAPAALKKKVKEAEDERDRYWQILCRASDALGGPTPEKAPYVDKWIERQNDHVDQHTRALKSAVESLRFCAPELEEEKIQNIWVILETMRQRVGAPTLFPKTQPR